METIKVYMAEITERKLLCETGWILPGGRQTFVGEPVILETKEYELPEGYTVKTNERGEREIVTPAGMTVCMVANLGLDGDVPVLPDYRKPGRFFRLKEVLERRTTHEEME